MCVWVGGWVGGWVFALSTVIVHIMYELRIVTLCWIYVSVARPLFTYMVQNTFNRTALVALSRFYIAL